MNSQMKDRKSRRRFAKLMSLTLSASLMLGNVVFAYAGVDDPNMPLSDTPNVSLEDEAGFIEENATASVSGAIDVASLNVSANVSPNSISINPIADPEKEITDQGMAVVSGNVVSDDEIVLSYNKDAKVASANTLSPNPLMIVGDVSKNSKDNVYVSFNVTDHSTSVNEKYYEGTTRSISVGSISWNNEGSSSDNAISINNGNLEVYLSGETISKTASNNSPETIVAAQQEAEKEIQKAQIRKNWGARDVVVSDDNLIQSVAWTTDNDTSTATLTISTNKGIISEDGLYFKGTATKENVATVTVSSDNDPVDKPEQITSLSGALKDKNISANINDINKTGKLVISVNKLSSLSVNGKAVTSANLTDANWKLELSANKAPASISVGDKLSANLLVTATSTNTVYAGNGTITNAATITVISNNTSDKPENKPEQITSLSGALKDKNISANINDINKTGKLAISVNKLSSLSVNGKAVTSANLTDANWKLELSANKAPASISVGDKLSANLLVKATSANKAYTGNGTIVNAATITVISGGNSDKPGTDTTKHVLEVSPKEVDWDGATITVSSDTAKECSFYSADKAIISDSDLGGLKPVSENCKFVSKNATYKTNWKDAGKYIAVVTGEKDTFSVSNCYVGKKVAVKDIKVDKTDFKVTMKDGKAVEKIEKITIQNVNGKTDPKVTLDDFDFEWDIPGTAKVNNDVKIKFTAKATNKYYTGSCSVTVGKVIKVTTTSVTKKNNPMKVSKTALTFKVGDKKAQTIKITKAQGKITYSIDKKGKKVIKVTANKTNTSLKVTPKTKKAAGVATITVKAAGNSTYKPATKKITVTVMPKQKPTAKVKSVKVVSKKAKTAKVTWKAIKNDKKVNGYQIQYATSKKGLSKGKLITVTGAKKATYTIKKLKKGKKIFVRVRAVNTKNGASNPSKKWSAVKSCKVK